MDSAQVRRRERWLALLVVAVMLVPPVVLANRIDRNNEMVTFLRWIDDQAGIDRGDWDDPLRTPIEASFYREVAETARAQDPEFDFLDIPAKWRIIRSADMQPRLASFLRLRAEGNVHLQGVTIDLTDSEVSANIGALVLGFTNAVADLLWLQVNATWEAGLINRMLPLMQTVVKLDPQFLDAYSLGSWHLAYNVASMKNDAAWKRKHLDLAIDFIEGGLRHNPRSAPLYEDLGFSLYFVKLEDFEQAAYYLQQGVKYHPHEARMEREAGLALERSRKETEALALFREFDTRHPTWTMQKLAIRRIERKLEARAMETAGDLRGAAALWRELDTATQSEPVAPIEVQRLEGLVQVQELEAAGKLAEARQEAFRLRNTLPEGYTEGVQRELDRLNGLLAQSPSPA